MSLKQRIAESDSQLRRDALERLKYAMDLLERELVLIELGPLTLCDDIEVKEQLTRRKRQ